MAGPNLLICVVHVQVFKIFVVYQGNHLVHVLGNLAKPGLALLQGLLRSSLVGDVTDVGDSKNVVKLCEPNMNRKCGSVYSLVNPINFNHLTYWRVVV